MMAEGRAADPNGPTSASTRRVRTLRLAFIGSGCHGRPDQGTEGRLGGPSES